MFNHITNFSIAGIKVKIESNTEIMLANQFENFIDEFSEVDLTFRICKLDKYNVEAAQGFEKVKQYKKNIDIFYKDGIYYKVAFTDKTKKEIFWCVEYDLSVSDFYNIYIFKPWESSLKKLDPFLLLGIPYLLSKFSSFLLHASVIDYEGTGILFTAPSQTGKSTQAGLWEKFYNASIINGDRAIIRQTDKYYVYGSPYAGSSEIYRNCKAQIGAIVVLRQSKDNSIVKLNKKQSYISLMSEMLICTDSKKIAEEQSDFLLKMVDEIPVYLLNCRPDREAVELLHTELQRSQTNEE